jgi:hypothetical protein
MTKMRQIGAILLLAMALNACKSEKPTDQRSATGEVLAGSISDSMLPYGSTKSQAPRAPEHIAAATAAASGADSGDPATEDTSIDAAKVSITVR